MWRIVGQRDAVPALVDLENAPTSGGGKLVITID